MLFNANRKKCSQIMVRYLALIIMSAAGYYLYTNYPVSHGPGIIVNESPKIERLRWSEPISFKGAAIHPVKTISGEVRIIKKRKYYFGNLARYSPVDVVVGWKELSDERNLDYLHFKLANRTYELNYTKPPVPLTLAAEQTDIWHLIPSDSHIEEQINRLRNGHVIYIKGLLINIENATHYEFTSATELGGRKPGMGFNIWVQELHIR